MRITCAQRGPQSGGRVRCERFMRGSEQGDDTSWTSPLRNAQLRFFANPEP